MIYVKSILVGLAGAIVGLVLWLMGEIAWAAIAVSREIARTTGSGGMVGFVGGFVWNVRRLKEKLA